LKSEYEDGADGFCFALPTLPADESWRISPSFVLSRQGRWNPCVTKGVQRGNAPLHFLLVPHEWGTKGVD